MKKIILFAAILCSSFAAVNAQPYIHVKNNTGRTVDLHFFSYTGGGCSNADIIFNAYRYPPSGSTYVDYDFASAGGGVSPTCSSSFSSPYADNCVDQGTFGGTWNFVKVIVSSDCNNNSLVLDLCSPSTGIFDLTSCASPFSPVTVTFSGSSPDWYLDIN